MRRFPGMFWMILLAAGQICGALLVGGCDEEDLVQPEPRCVVSPASVQFGDVEMGQSKELSFTLRNEGDASLSGSISVNCERFSIVEGGGDYSIAPGATQTVTVAFNTSDSGDFECDLEVGNRCGDQIHLMASGVRPVVVPPGGDDHFVPSPVSDLAVIASTPTTLTLGWTAVGDDGLAGRASLYALRWSTNANSTWANAIPITDLLPAPGFAGYFESYTVTDLDPGTTYYFWLMVADDYPNWSEVSNRAAGTTDPLPPPPPGAIDNLTAGKASPFGILLGWTSPSGDLNVEYDIRYATMEATSWDEMIPLGGEPTPESPGTFQEYMAEVGPSPFGTYYFEIRTLDADGNISPRSNRLFVEMELLRP